MSDIGINTPAVTEPSGEVVNPLVPVEEVTEPEHVDRWDAAFAGLEDQFLAQLDASGDSATIPDADGVQTTDAPVEPITPDTAPVPNPVTGGVHPAPSDGVGAPTEPVADPVVTPPAPLYPVAEPLTIGNLTIPRDQAEQQLTWLNSLTPDQQNAIAQALAAPAPATPQSPASAASGPGVPAPVAQVYQAPATAPTGSPAGVGAAVPTLDPESLAVLEAAAPGIGAYFAAQQSQTAQQAAQLAAYQQSVQQQSIQQAQQAQLQTQAQIDAAHQSYVTLHPEFAPTDIDVIAQRGAQLQILPSMMRQHNGDLTAAYHATLDAAMWADPVTRDRAVQAQFAASQQAQQQINSRRTRAASLSGTTGTVPRGLSATPVAQMSPQDKHAAITEAISAAQSAPNP